MRNAEEQEGSYSECGAEDKAFDYMIHIYSENTEKREGEHVLPEVHHRQDV